MPRKKPVKYNINKPMEKVKPRYKTIGLWINDKTSTENSSSMTRADLDVLFASCGVTFQDRFYFIIRPHYYRSDPSLPDRFLEVVLVNSRDEFMKKNVRKRVINGMEETVEKEAVE